MNEWTVRTPGSTVTVEAHRAETTPVGVLLLVENSGVLVRAFAPGAWLECELSKRGAVGYAAGTR